MKKTLVSASQERIVLNIEGDVDEASSFKFQVSAPQRSKKQTNHSKAARIVNKRYGCNEIFVF